MPALDDICLSNLAALERKHQKRQLKTTLRQDGVHVMREGKKLISFSCNDYLGLTHHPTVIAAARQALDQYGTGAGASRLVTGNHPLYEQLESKLAAWKGTKAACVFGSGYMANLGIIPALMGRDDLILADRLAHACLLDAARLTGADLIRFTHNNVEHCRLMLSQHRSHHTHCMIITESVFSMDGDVAPLAELAALAIEYDAWLLTDDAHGLGVIGDGKGSASLALPVDIPLQMGTLSKAIGGYGGYLCASLPVIEYLHSAARSLVYTTGLPPSVIATAIAALDIIMNTPELVRRPLKKARRFTHQLGLPEAQSAVVPLMLKETEKALAASTLLEKEGFLVTAIRPPTVPENTARLRFAFSALHADNDIDRIAAFIHKQGWVQT